MDDTIIFRPTSIKLMDQVRETLRFYHYAYSTEKSYIDLITRFIKFNGTRHPKDMGKREIERYLSHLASNRNVAASTHNQAFNAIIFLYKKVLNIQIDLKISARRTSKKRYCRLY